MIQLEALEKKVMSIVETNKVLREETISLQQENKSLREKVGQLEASLIKESGSSEVLNSETESIRASIDELIENIDSLQMDEQ